MQMQNRRLDQVDEEGGYGGAEGEGDSPTALSRPAHLQAGDGLALGQGSLSERMLDPSIGSSHPPSPRVNPAADPQAATVRQTHQPETPARAEKGSHPAGKEKGGQVSGVPSVSSALMQSLVSDANGGTRTGTEEMGSLMWLLKQVESSQLGGGVFPPSSNPPVSSEGPVRPPPLTGVGQTWPTNATNTSGQHGHVPSLPVSMSKPHGSSAMPPLPAGHPTPSTLHLQPQNQQQQQQPVQNSCMPSPHAATATELYMTALGARPLQPPHFPFPFMFPQPPLSLSPAVTATRVPPASCAFGWNLPGCPLSSLPPPASSAQPQLPIRTSAVVPPNVLLLESPVLVPQGAVPVSPSAARGDDCQGETQRRGQSCQSFGADIDKRASMPTVSASQQQHQQLYQEANVNEEAKDETSEGVRSSSPTSFQEQDGGQGHVPTHRQQTPDQAEREENRDTKESESSRCDSFRVGGNNRKATHEPAFLPSSLSASLDSGLLPLPADAESRRVAFSLPLQEGGEPRRARTPRGIPPPVSLPLPRAPFSSYSAVSAEVSSSFPGPLKTARAKRRGAGGAVEHSLSLSRSEQTEKEKQWSAGSVSRLPPRPRSSCAGCSEREGAGEMDRPASSLSLPSSLGRVEKEGEGGSTARAPLLKRRDTAAEPPSSLLCVDEEEEGEGEGENRPTVSGSGVCGANARRRKRNRNGRQRAQEKTDVAGAPASVHERAETVDVCALSFSPNEEEGRGTVVSPPLLIRPESSPLPGEIPLSLQEKRRTDPGRPPAPSDRSAARRPPVSVSVSSSQTAQRQQQEAKKIILSLMGEKAGAPLPPSESLCDDRNGYEDGQIRWQNEKESQAERESNPKVTQTAPPAQAHSHHRSSALLFSLPGGASASSSRPPSASARPSSTALSTDMDSCRLTSSGGFRSVSPAADHATTGGVEDSNVTYPRVGDEGVGVGLGDPPSFSVDPVPIHIHILQGPPRPAVQPSRQQIQQRHTVSFPTQQQQQPSPLMPGGPLLPSRPAGVVRRMSCPSTSASQGPSPAPSPSSSQQQPKHDTRLGGVEKWGNGEQVGNRSSLSPSTQADRREQNESASESSSGKEGGGGTPPPAHSTPSSLFLREIRGQVAELCRSKNGRHRLQRALSFCSPEEVQEVVAEVSPHVVDLMKDPSGNFACKHLFEVCSVKQRTLLLEKLLPHTVEIACDSKGTHALQSLIGHVSTPKEEELLASELEDRAVEVAVDPNGTYVLQRLLVCFYPQSSLQLVERLVASAGSLLGTSHGVYVLDKCLSLIGLGRDGARDGRKVWRALVKIVQALERSLVDLVQTKHGAKLVKQIFEKWGVDCAPCRRLVEALRQKALPLTVHKLSQEVIEKCLDTQDEELRDGFIEELTHPDRLEVLFKAATSAQKVLSKAASVASEDRKRMISKAVAELQRQAGQTKPSKWEKSLQKFQDQLSAHERTVLRLGPSSQQSHQRASSHSHSQSHSQSPPSEAAAPVLFPAAMWTGGVGGQPGEHREGRTATREPNRHLPSPHSSRPPAPPPSPSSPSHLLKTHANLSLDFPSAVRPPPGFDERVVQDDDTNEEHGLQQQQQRLRSSKTNQQTELAPPDPSERFHYLEQHTPVQPQEQYVCYPGDSSRGCRRGGEGGRGPGEDLDDEEHHQMLVEQALSRPSHSHAHRVGVEERGRRVQRGGVAVPWPEHSPRDSMSASAYASPVPFLCTETGRRRRIGEREQQQAQVRQRMGREWDNEAVPEGQRRFHELKQEDGRTISAVKRETEEVAPRSQGHKGGREVCSGRRRMGDDTPPTLVDEGRRTRGLFPRGVQMGGRCAPHQNEIDDGKASNPTQDFPPRPVRGGQRNSPLPPSPSPSVQMEEEEEALQQRRRAFLMARRPPRILDFPTLQGSQHPTHTSPWGTHTNAPHTHDSSGADTSPWTDDTPFSSDSVVSPHVRTNGRMTVRLFHTAAAAEGRDPPMIDPSRFLREISIGDDDQEPKCARPETRGMHKKASEWFWKSPDGVSVRLLEETEEGDIPVRGAETEREREREETNLRTPAHISSMLASPNPSVDIPSVPTNFHAGKKDIHPIPLKVSLQALAQIASERETRQRLTRPSDPHQLPPSPQVAPVNSNVAASPETRHDHRTEASAGPRSYRRNVRVSPPFRHEPPHHSHAPPQHERRAQSAKAPASDQSHSPLATSDFLDAVMARLKLTESSVQHLLNSSLQSHRDAQQFPPRSHLPATQTPALSYQNQRLGRGDRPSDSPCRSTASHSHSSSSSGGPGRDGFIEAGDERRSRPTEETPTSTSTRATNIRRAARRAVFAEERAVRGEKERGETERERDRDSLQTPSGPPRWSRGLVEATNLSDLISPVPSQVSPAVSGAHAEHPATVSVQGREGGRSRTGGRPREARAAVPRTRLNDAYNGGGLQSQHIQLQRDQNKGGDERSKQRGGQGGPAARGKLGENESRKSSKDICPVRPSLC